jgi:hypothetical protein
MNPGSFCTRDSRGSLGGSLKTKTALYEMLAGIGLSLVGVGVRKEGQPLIQCRFGRLYQRIVLRQPPH